MKKTRKIFYLVSGVTSAIVIAAACSFPEPRIVEDGDGSTGEDSGDAMQDGSDEDVVTDAGPRADVVEPDAPPPIGDATSEKPPVDANCDPCDCDDDGYLSEAGACFDGGTLYDCDDQDIRANPDSGYRDDPVTKDTNGDWNCDRKTNREFNVLINCADYSASALNTGCTAVEGFFIDPPCGATASYVKCKNAGALQPCQQGEIVDEVQRCK